MLDHNTFWFSRGTGGVNTVAKIMFLNLGIRVPGIWVFQQFFKQKHRTGKPGKQLLALLLDLLCGDNKGNSCIFKNELYTVIGIIRGCDSKCTTSLQNTLTDCVKVTTALQYHTYDFFTANAFFNKRICNSVCPFVQLCVGKAFLAGSYSTFVRMKPHLLFKQLCHRLKFKNKIALFVNVRHFLHLLK